MKSAIARSGISKRDRADGTTSVSGLTLPPDVVIDATDLKEGM